MQRSIAIVAPSYGASPDWTKSAVQKQLNVTRGTQPMARRTVWAPEEHVPSPAVTACVPVTQRVARQHSLACVPAWTCVGASAQATPTRTHVYACGLRFPACGRLGMHVPYLPRVTLQTHVYTNEQPRRAPVGG